jgi:peptide/nickel transport system ATP-binding protein
MAMIFQEPMTSLNPGLRIGEQIAESVRRHKGVGQAEARARALEMLGACASPPPKSGSTNTRTSCRGACASAR